VGVDHIYVWHEAGNDVRMSGDATVLDAISKTAAREILGG